MFTSNQEKQLFLTAGLASFVYWGKFLPLPQSRSIAEPGSLKDIVQHPLHKSQFPRSSLCLQITNYCGICHSPSAGLSRNTKKQNGTETLKKKKVKKELLHWRHCKMLPQPSYIIATLIQSWPWAAFHLNPGHGLANSGSGVHLMSSRSQGKLCPHTWTGAAPEWMPSNTEQCGCWVLGTKWSHPLLAGARKFLEWAIKSSATCYLLSLGDSLGQVTSFSSVSVLCLTNRGNGANSLL